MKYTELFKVSTFEGQLLKVALEENFLTLIKYKLYFQNWTYVIVIQESQSH